MSGEEKDGKGTITIRGIDKKIYNKLSSLSREMDKTIGEALNEAMSLFITLAGMVEGIDKNIMVIQGHDKLEVTGKELEDVDKKVLFMNIDELVFKDVDPEIFDKKIHKISNVKTLRIVGDMNKLKVYGKCMNVKKVVFEK